MNKLLYSAFIAFLASLFSIWLYAHLATQQAAQNALAAQDAQIAPAADKDAAASAQQPALPLISLAELAQHDSAEDCWMAIDGKVYDFTRYIPEHPSAPEVMLRWCGQEASEAYHTKGYGRRHSRRADAMLPAYLVAELAQ